MQRVKIQGAAQYYVALQQKLRYRTHPWAGLPNVMESRKMSASSFDVPSDLRDFAERSVEQARKAFEGFLAAAQRTTGAAGDTAGAGQGGAKSIGSHVLSYTEQNAKAAFDFANKLVRAKDPQEFFALQSEYLKSQLSALQTQAKELGVVFQRSVTPSSN